MSLVACDDGVTLIVGGSEPDAGPVDQEPPSSELITDAGIDARAPIDVIDASQGAAVLDATIVRDAAVDTSAPLDCSELSYDNFGAEFLYTWCLSCHGKMEPLFTTPELVRLWAPAIRDSTVDNKRMPEGGGALYLRDPQRAQLGRWLDCGAP